MSVQAEMSLLGAVFLMCDEDHYVADAANALSSEMFTNKHTRKIFDKISDLYWKGRKIDHAVLLGEMPDEKVTLVQLAQYVPHISHFGDYIRIIQEDWQLQLLHKGLKEIGGSGKDLTDTLGDLRELLTKQEQLAMNNNDENVSSFAEAAEELKAWLRDKERNDTVRCGFEELDRATGGFLRSTVFGLAARPGCGKTDLAINLALKMGKRGARVLYFTMEMSKLQLMQRVVSSMLRINGERVRDRMLTEKELAAVDDILDKFESAGRISFVEEPSVSVQRVRHFVDLWKPDVVFIDHIGLMKRPNIKEQYKAIGMVSNQLKQLALEKSISIVELVQMNRQIENRANKKPTLSDLRESGDIEQDCDYVGFLVPEDLKGKNLSGDESADTTLFLEKNRHGRPGIFRYRWQPQYHSFSEVETRYG